MIMLHGNTILADIAPFRRRGLRGKHRGRVLGAFGGPKRRKDAVRAAQRAFRAHHGL
jgi:hypothetical protein